MLWMELYPRKTHRLNPNPQSGSLWGQSWKEIIKVKWGHKGGVVIQWHWWSYKRGRERDFSPCAYKEEVLWAQWNGDNLQSKRRGLRMKPSLVVPWSWAAQPPEQWEISFCCSSHPVYSTCYGSLRWLIQLTTTLLSIPLTHNLLEWTHPNLSRASFDLLKPKEWH